MVSSSLARLSTDIAAQGETRPPLFASAGLMSQMSQSELKTLGWETMHLD
jgi:hypothetical protein